MPQPPLLVFETSIRNFGSTGSCLFKLLQPLLGNYPLHVFANDSDLPDSPLLTQFKIPLPRRPVFLRMFLYSLLSGCAYALSGFKSGVRVSNDGQFPFCDICYYHFSPRFLLSHRHEIATSAARRFARTLTYRWYALLQPLALRRAVKIVVPSQGLARELETTFPLLTKNKIEVIPNPVDTAHFRRAPEFDSAAMRTRLGISPDAFVLTFCALASFTAKGLKIIFEALEQIADPRIHLIVIGGHAGEIGEYSNLARELRLTDKVHFVGLQTDIRPYLWCSQLFVLPSAYETFGLVCFQAAAAGLPIIATRVYGLEEFLSNGVNGYLVERNVESLASAIRLAAASPETAAALGEKAQHDVKAYDTAIFQSRWLDLLEKEFGIRAVEQIEFAHN